MKRQYVFQEGGLMSKGKKCILIAMFLLFVSFGISKAEPTPTISYLINTPVSMLDLGTYKLENFLIEQRKHLTIKKTASSHKCMRKFIIKS
jgi:hypothetical protein